MSRKIRRYVAAICAGILSTSFGSEKTAGADDPKVITSGACPAVELKDIPIGDFQSFAQMPEAEMRITQIYDNTYVQGYCNADDGSQPPSNDPRCVGKLIWYGHDGIDIHQEGAPAGQNSILSAQNGVVILSRKKNSDSGWGETEIIATRASQYSEEILTYQYSHLHQTGSGDNYTTTRLYNACDQVTRGAEIAKEGMSGTVAPHLHFSIRRWKNIGELKKAIGSGGAGLLGHGYSFGDDGRLGGFLDPEGILYNKFRDLENVSHNDAFLGKPFMMREKGIEFGFFNGSYGINDFVKRREMARWVKIGLQLQSYTGTQATFQNDLPASDADFPYIEALARISQSPKIIDPNHSCYAWTQSFCPDKNVNRAEALKMAILAFYRDGFLKVHDNWFWRAEKAYGMALLNKFKDVNPLYWYSEYVYYGSTIGIVEEQDYFRPDDPISRAEIAKWIINGNSFRFGSLSCAKCDNLHCSAGQYCDDSLNACMPISACVPTESQACEMGGGYDPCLYGECQAGQKGLMDCTPGGQAEITCNGECKWQQSGDCKYNQCTPGQASACTKCGSIICQSNGQYGACENQGTCNPGQTETQTCNSTGTILRTCGSNCQWGAWGQCSINPVCQNGAQQSCGLCGTQTCTAGQWSSCQNQSSCSAPNCVCSGGPCCDGCNHYSSSWSCDQSYAYQCEGPSAGQNAQQAIIRRYCSGNSSQCDGQTQQFGWTTLEDCSNAQVCQMSGGVPKCIGVCQDQYLKNTSSPCLYNGGTVGTPTICLELQQVSGANWKYRACKQNGVFGNQSQDIKYRLADANNMVQFAYYTEKAGNSCTDWHDFSVNYIAGNGSTNGAGLYAEILSPASCSQSSCNYRTGVVTIYKECQ